MAQLLQEDFSGGVFRGRRAPANSVFDAVNALVNDEGGLYRRGGSAYKATAPGSFGSNANLDSLADVFTPVGRRTLFGVAGGGGTGGGWWALDVDDVTPIRINGNMPTAYSRPASTAGLIAFPSAFSAPVIVYGGSRKNTDYSTGTATVTNGSQAVVGVGTAWSANVDAGMIFWVGGQFGIVESVTSNTALTLTAAWSSATVAGTAYLASVVLQVASVDMTTGPYLQVGVDPVFVAGAHTRLIIAAKQRVWYSDADNPVSFTVNNFHELPAAARIIGADAFEDTAVIFTTTGIYAVANLDLDPIDAAGNQQHQVSRVSEMVLWGDPGIAGWSGRLVVPALDGVYLWAPGVAPQPVAGGIGPLYRSYVASGYQPGTATVHRSTYVLPVLNGASLVDTLVCRLDRPVRDRYGNLTFPWTRWAGHAAGVAYAQRVGDLTRSPKLFGLSGRRVTDLTGCMESTGSASDADASTPTFTVIGPDGDTGAGIRPNTAEKIRFVYEAAGAAPSIAASTAVGLESASFTAAVLKRGGGASDGTDYSAWRVGRKAERIRWKFECASAVTSLVLRRAEWTVRQAGQS